MIKEVDKFKFEAIPDKISTLKCEWEVNKNKFEWILNMGNSKLRSDWIQIVNDHYNNVNPRASFLPESLPENSAKVIGIQDNDMKKVEEEPKNPNMLN